MNNKLCVTRFMMVYAEKKKELDAILKDAPDRGRYEELVRQIEEIRKNKEILSAPWEEERQIILNGEQDPEADPRGKSYLKNKEAYRKAIQEVNRILSDVADPDDNHENILLEGPDDTAKKMKIFARELKSVLENDYALLYTAEPEEITSIY